MTQSGHRIASIMLVLTGATVFGAAMRRRDFVTVLGGARVFWPMGARAQQLAKPVIGFLHSASPGQYVGHLAAFRQGLSEVGSSTM